MCQSLLQNPKLTLSVRVPTAPRDSVTSRHLNSRLPHVAQRPARHAPRNTLGISDRSAMDDLQRGPRRARRVAQHAAAIRTPEVASTPPGPSSDVEPHELNAAQRLLRNYFAEQGTPPPPRGKPYPMPSIDSAPSKCAHSTTLHVRT